MFLESGDEGAFEYFLPVSLELELSAAYGERQNRETFKHAFDMD